MKAERQMQALEAASFPDMDKQSRREVLNKYRAELGPGSRPAAATVADLASLGIKVTEVTADALPADRDKLGQDEG